MRITSLTRAHAQADGPRGPRSIADLPGPRGLPLVGVAHRLLPTTRMHLTIEGWGRRYGPIVRADVGRRTIVGVSDPDEIHRILRERPEGFRRWRDQMLAAQQVDGSFSDEEIAGNVFALMIAGEDTTAHTLAWTVWFLARRPDVQARLAQEAEELLGERVAPADYKTVNASRYGEAVLRESMRLKSVAPLALVEPLTDMAICGTQIPAHTCLLLALRLANLAQEPSSEFDPERFLGEDQERASKSLVFGAGPRFCPGRNLAFLEAKSALLTIARNFEVELDDSAAPVTERFGFTMAPGGLRVRLKQRAAAPSFVHAAAGLR